jgi:hypothetical protein
MGKPISVWMLMALCSSVAWANPEPSRRSGMANAQGAVEAAAAPIRTIQFSGITWAVKSSAGDKWGPGPNDFSDSSSNVWVDEQGRLHLKISYEGGVWKCAEVIAQRSFGYGTYRFKLDTPVDALDPNAVLGLFTWNDDPAYHNREMDIEFSRWGNPLDPTNVQFTVQPYTLSANFLRWTLNPGYASSTHSWRWTSRSVAFESSSAGNPLAQWSYSKRSGIPKAGGENPRINLWLFRGAAPLNGQSQEVIVTSFEFLR